MSDAKIAIQINHVSKEFLKPGEKKGSLKETFVNFGKKNRHKKQHVLNDVTFSIEKGDFFGIVGRNGSGKSTLLKIIAGVYQPTAGNVHINGSLTPFIELGVGFNPELSGRDNVFLNGALLGFSRSEMQKLYDEIVDFAELHDAMDKKLKNYSSGMQVRLAFSIAIKAKKDILIFDEVLAVGDEAFQTKCLRVFEEYKANKQTVVLVTHDMETVKKFCNKAVVIAEGKIEYIGSPFEAADIYSGMNDLVNTPVRRVNDNIKAIINNRESNKFEPTDKLSINLTWDVVGVKNASILFFKSTGEYVFGTSTQDQKQNLLEKKNEINFEVDLILSPGTYRIEVGLFGDNRKQIITYSDNVLEFEVKSKESLKWSGLTNLKHSWR